MTLDPRDAHGGGLILPLGDHTPRIAPGVFVAPGAIVIGDVEMAEGSSLWFNCVARADVAPIRVGARSNVQDGSILHADPGYPTLIGADVLIGHAALLHGCRIEDGGFVGMGAIVMNGCVVEGGGMVAAGALLSPGKVVRARELWAGRPARLMRAIGDEEAARLAQGPERYRRNASLYLAESARWARNR